MGVCEARIPGHCLGRAASKHHRDKRGRVWRPSNVLDLCGDGTTGCHGWVEHHADEANELGLWLRYGEPPECTPFTGYNLGEYGRWILDDSGGVHPAVTAGQT